MSLAVAVSGGVDSLFALHLLRRQTREVTAVHALLLPERFQSRERLAGLRQACRRLGVPLEVVDLRQAFEDRVVEPFARTYLEGWTPNPCAICNRSIKFGLLAECARGLGAKQLATGHYARLGQAGGPVLGRGRDRGKDQSYFLALCSRDQLALALAPLGQWTKAEVLQALQGLDFTLPQPGESQEICFVDQDGYRAFLQARDRDLPGPGPVLDSAGRQLGRHQGLHGYTIGQRRGLGIPHTEPLYVLHKDSNRNTLIVGPRHELAASGLRTGPPELLADPQTWPERVLVQTAYRQQARPARVRLVQDGLVVRYEQPQTPASPGQVAAIYAAGGQVLAGATVQDSLSFMDRN